LRANRGVAIRVFTDSQGVEWRVWSTVPSNAGSVAPDLRDGWLSFDSGSQRRRIGPIPTGWENISVERLELLCRVAVPTRTSDPFGVLRAADVADAVGEDLS
jgi:hypothetical protein